MDLLSLHAWLPLLLVALAAIVARRVTPPRLPPALDRWARGMGLPLTLGIASAVIVRYVWGGWHPVAFIHDEASYLLEAETLARGHFTAPVPPLPAFFEQYHVFTTPVLASRYPAGWPLALVPGIWIGMPILMPLLLTGITGGFLGALVRRVAGPVAAIVAWLWWIAPPIALRFRPTFLSEHLSTALWVVGFWALWRWREDRRTRWLVLLSLSVAWDGITRPLTAIAFALPVAAVVLHDAVRRRKWRPLLPAGLAGLLLCLVIPLQNRAVTGRWDRLPMKEFSERYAPFDLPGFGLDTRHPTEALSPFQKAYNNGFRPVHPDHVPDRIPQILGARLGQFVHQSAGGWGAAGLLALALIGLFTGGPAMAFAGLTAVSLFVCYLWFAHPEHWVAYYMEAHLVYAAAVGIGAHRLVERLLGWRADPTASPLAPARASLALTIAAAGFAFRLPDSIAIARSARASIGRPNAQVAEIAARIPGRAILFIRYAPGHQVERNFVENHYDLAAERVWRVHDLGARNAELIRLAPDRIPVLYDEATGDVVQLGPDGVTRVP